MAAQIPKQWSPLSLRAAKWAWVQLFFLFFLSFLIGLTWNLIMLFLITGISIQIVTIILEIKKKKIHQASACSFAFTLQRNKITPKKAPREKKGRNDRRKKEKVTWYSLFHSCCIKLLRCYTIPQIYRSFFPKVILVIILEIYTVVQKEPDPEK